jgi:hypothetical protein
VSAGFSLAPDAAMVLGIASTAMAFARTPDAEAERWLRALRLHGEAGMALQALGVSDGPLGDLDGGVDPERAGSVDVEGRDAVVQVAEHAARIASRRGAAEITTADVLIAVMRVYGEDFDRVLRAHGTDGDAVLERLQAPRAVT